MKHTLFTLLIAAMLWTQSLTPILDGRIIPVILEKTYSFSNFEWARGFVVFKNGFSVGSTNTIILNLDYPVNGIINLKKGGTIILNGDLSLGQDCVITESGYIQTNNRTIYFSNSNFSITSTIFFSGTSVTLNGKNVGTINMQPYDGALHFKPINTLSLQNVDIYLNNPQQEIIFPPTNLATLELVRTSITTNPYTTFTLYATTINASGDNYFYGEGSTLVIPTIFNLVDSSSSFLLGEFTTCMVNDLNLGAHESIFTLNHLSSIIFTKLTTTTLGGNGKFFCKGKSTIKTQNQMLLMNANHDIVIDSGGRLMLDSTHLRTL